MCRNMRRLSQFATQRAPAGNGPARSNPGGEGPHPQPADSQKNPRGTAAATRARGPVSHPAGRRYADPPTGRKGQDDGHEWAEDRAAHSLSVVLFTSRTMVAGLSGMASGCGYPRSSAFTGKDGGFIVAGVNAKEWDRWTTRSGHSCFRLPPAVPFARAWPAAGSSRSRSPRSGCSCPCARAHSARRPPHGSPSPIRFTLK